MALKKLDKVDHKWGLQDWESRSSTKRFGQEVANDIKALTPVALAMARYIHDHKFPCVLVGGTSAQSGAYLVKEAWKKIYGKEKMPKFLTIPRPYNSSTSMHLGEARTVTSFLERYSKLSLKDKENVFILEEYVGTGKAVSNLNSFAKKVGFKNIKVGTLSHSPGLLHKHSVDLDFIGLNEKQLGGSWPRFFKFRREVSKPIFAYRTLRENEKRTMSVKEIRAHSVGQNAIRSHSALRAMRRVMRRAIK
ncbi:MAG: hypothetical protein WCW44_00390 [archaeon]|jgi:hypothetical protein